MTRSSSADRYDQAYFDKWYRHPQHRVKTPRELARQVAFVLAAAEWVLDQSSDRLAAEPRLREVMSLIADRRDA